MIMMKSIIAVFEQYISLATGLLESGGMRRGDRSEEIVPKKSMSVESLLSNPESS